MLADIWKNYPLVTLLVLAALQSIPEDLYEAARLDGASSWRRFRAITFPGHCRPARRGPGPAHHRCV
jgi:multiple sugar transport system permease protein